MFIVGHRGARAAAPENTLNAIRTGMACAGFIEVDVRLSLDRVPVLMHDPEVDRTTDGRGRVRDMTSGELAHLDAGHGEHVPTLTDVCSLVRGTCGLFIEVKEPGTEMEICAVLDREQVSPLWVVSYHSSVLETVTEILPGTTTGLIFSRQIPGAVDNAVKKNIHALLPRFDVADQDLVTAAHSKGILVVPWTLNRAGDWARAADMGVDGFTTDDPCAAKAWMDAVCKNST